MSINGRLRKQLWVVLLLSVLITFLTFFVTEGIIGSVGGGFSISMETHGFPLPFYYEWTVTTYRFSFDFLNLGIDFLIWFLICFAVVTHFTGKLALLSIAFGLVVTAITLFLPPLPQVTPVANSFTYMRPMGFPFEYLLYYQTLSLTGSSNSGYYFDLLRALADFSLWSGVSYIVILCSKIPNRIFGTKSFEVKKDAGKAQFRVPSISKSEYP